MKDFRSRKKNNSFFGSNIFFLGFIFLSIFVLFFLISHVYDISKKKNLVRDEQQKVFERLENLQKKRDRLQSEIDFLKTKEGITEEYKKHYDVVEPGEFVVKIVYD